MISVASFAWAQKSYKTVEVNKPGNVKVVYYVNESEGVTAFNHYVSDQLFEQGFFKDNKRDGIWSRFDEQGNKLAEASYKNGVKQGTWAVWNNDGTMLYQIHYRNNKVLSAVQWNENGELVATR